MGLNFEDFIEVMAQIVVSGLLHSAVWYLDTDIIVVLIRAAVSQNSFPSCHHVALKGAVLLFTVPSTLLDFHFFSPLPWV
jgi:hypothetical protein